MPPGRTQTTAEGSTMTFYDIESLANAFTLCAYTPRPGADTADDLEIFYLLDDEGLNAQVGKDSMQDIYARLISANPGLPTVETKLNNLRSLGANLRLAEIVGLSDSERVWDPDHPGQLPSRLRPVCDTDPEYDPAVHPFLAGYNSMNYDTVMLACYMLELRMHLPTQQQSETFEPVTAASMRTHNDALFSPEHIEAMPMYLDWNSPAGRIRRAMIASGRHLDVARLNELQSKVGLKRLLGMLGHQIKESEKLSHDTRVTSFTDLAELIAYNVSDCLGLAQLFGHPIYRNAFDLKAGLLAQFSETVYDHKGRVRKDRLTIDSSSAKFVGRILAPYQSLKDIETVSFDYPHPEVAKEQGIEPFNVLTACRRMVHEHVTDPEVRAQFEQVHDYYRSIEGKNFNDSPEHTRAFGQPVHVLKEIPKMENNLPYRRGDESASTCFVTFSTGGIHGAEYDAGRFTTDQLTHLKQQNMLLRARRDFPDPKDLVEAIRGQHNRLTLPDGSHVDKRLVLLGSDPAKVRYRRPKDGDPEQNEQLARATAQVEDPADLLATQRGAEEELHLHQPDGDFIDGKEVLVNTSATSATYREAPKVKNPELFKVQTKEFEAGSSKLNPRYAHTSAGHVIHEDFTSYYPNLLRNMRAFYNPDLGQDRYAQMFFDKERYGRMLKEPGITPEEKERLTTLREGTKLILNSASGAGDAAHANPIRMNNRIISMRIIGQLFTYMVGQSQTRAGAKIISTNTDGLYSLLGGEDGFDAERNNEILAEQQATIGVDIEPEPMYLISKDSNSRLELVPDPADERGQDAPLTEWRIKSASGSSLKCHDGPSPSTSLAHPAVLDHGLARYLQTVAAHGVDRLAEDFDVDLGRKILQEAIDPLDPVATLLLFQNVIAASRGSITYPFALDTDRDDVARPLQMINRVLIVRPGTEGAVNLRNAGAWKVTPDSREKRRKEGLASIVQEPTALSILRHHGWVPTAREAQGSAGLVQLPDDQDVVVRKINSIDPTWPMLVVNDDLHALPPARLAELVESLDVEVYLGMLQEIFTKNWKNTPAATAA